jgi:hypothetical protein
VVQWLACPELGHIILILSQSVFVHIPQCCVCSCVTSNTNIYRLWCDPTRVQNAHLVLNNNHSLYIKTSVKKSVCCNSTHPPKVSAHTPKNITCIKFIISFFLHNLARVFFCIKFFPNIGNAFHPENLHLNLRHVLHVVYKWTFLINDHTLYVYYLSDCCLTPSEHLFQPYHGENKLHFDIEMMSALYLTNTLSWIFIVIAHGYI